MYGLQNIRWYGLGVVVRDSGSQCIRAMCAKLEIGNGHIEVQALGLWSAVRFAVDLGLQEVEVGCVVKNLIDEVKSVGPTNL